MPGRCVMVLFRMAVWSRSRPLLTILFFWYLILYKVFIEWLSGIQISTGASIAPGLRLEGCRGTSIDSGTVIGANCTLRQLTTIGRKKLVDNSYSNSPRIGDNVDIGVNAIIIGQVEIGNNVVIGAGAVVTKSVSDHSVMAGNPAKLLKKVYDFPGSEERENKIEALDETVTLLDRV